MDEPRVAEAHLVLGRVHVHVDPARVELQEQHVGRLPAVVHDVRIRQLDRVRHRAVTDRAAVAVQVLLVGAGAVVRGPRDPAMQAQPGALVVDAHRMAGELRAQGLVQAHIRQQVGLALPAPRRLAVVRDPQLHLGPGQRELAQPFLDVPELGALGAQELAPRRDVVEQVADLDGGPARVRPRHRRRDPATVDLDGVGVLVLLPPRGDAEAAHRSDRRQRFAAKAEAGDALQVLQRGDLAGGVARHRQRQFVRRDAAPVVADADQAGAALLQVDVHPPGTGIQRVFDQLLDHRRRALDHLAGGDLVDQGVGERADLHSGAAIGAAVHHSLTQRSQR